MDVDLAVNGECGWCIAVDIKGIAIERGVGDGSDVACVSTDGELSCSRECDVPGGEECSALSRSGDGSGG